MRIIVGLSLAFSCLTGFAAVEPTGRYKIVLDRLTALQKLYPSISHIYSIGTNDEGVEIYAMRVSTSPTAMDKTKIGQMVVSTHHGNELAAPEFTMAFTADLLKRFSSDELWRGKLADMEFTIIPVLNISGYNAARREEHGRDPNRDYAGPCNSKTSGALGSIRRLVALFDLRSYAGSVTVHGYDGSITYPWGMFTDNYHSKDHNMYQQIFQKAAVHNGYRTGTAADVVYPCDGAYEDWVYWKHGSWSLLLELKNGSPNDIATTVPAIATFFDLLDSSPSVQNQHTGNCKRYDGPDLRLE